LVIGQWLLVSGQWSEDNTHPRTHTHTHTHTHPWRGGRAE
jgi:hypothetical protein